jgi:hypothetical protein
MNVDDLKTAFYTVIFNTVVAEKLEGFTITAERMETLAKNKKAI